MHYFANSNPLPHIFIIYERVLIHVLEMQVLMCMHYMQLDSDFFIIITKVLINGMMKGGGGVTFTFIQDYIENKLC